MRAAPAARRSCRRVPRATALRARVRRSGGENGGGHARNASIIQSGDGAARVVLGSGGASRRASRGVRQEHGAWVYLLLFVIVFCETGLVVTPFLPGDSLLFVTGAVAAAGGMDIAAVMATLIAAALCGDNVNYWVGRWLGPRVFHFERSRWFNPRTCNAPTPSTSATAARPSSSRASCRSCAPTSRSSPASAPCHACATSPSASSVR